MRIWFPAGLLPRVLLLVTFTLWLSLNSSAIAQMKGTPAEQPFLIGYARDVTPKRAFGYFEHLSTQLSIGESMMEQMDRAELELTSQRVERPIIGTAWYLVTGLMPTFETVTFQQCADVDDARRILAARVKQYGGSPGGPPGASVTDLPNDCFKLEHSFHWSVEANENTRLEDYSYSGSIDRSAEFVEVDGKRKVQVTQKMVIYMRYQSGLLFESRFEELTTMNLPADESVLRAARGETDLGFEAYLDRIPIGIRTLGWNLVNSGAGVQMQPRDDEPEELYGIRQTSGDLLLPLLRAVLFDVDSADGWATFANAEKDSLHGRLTVHTRGNGQFGNDLKQMASGRSLFAPVLNDHAALTFHTCVQLPEKIRDVGLSAASFLKYTARQKLPVADPRLVDIDLAAMSLEEMGERGTFELLLKIGWTAESGGVVYGGLQTGENPELVPALYRLATAADPDAADLFSLTTTEEGPLLLGRIPEQASREMAQYAGIRPTHLYLLHSNSCLWFALGGEHADQAVREAARTCAASPGARTPLASGSFDAAKWLEYPQDDPTGIAGMLHWLDEHEGVFPPIPGFMARNETRPALLEKVIDLGGDADAQFSVVADDSGLVLNARLGKALGNYYVARLIESQDRRTKLALERQREQQEATKRAMEEAAKTKDESADGQ
ncbi:MAG: hypothetical protein KDA85_17765 [Planctomycetaceae bacterium]|nr:hypothetical protein [Planctomycetaceae bacterium]